MDYKNSKAGKQADKEVVGGVNAEMAPVQEMDDWEVVTQEDWLRSVKRDSIGKAVVSMLNVLRGNATPTERVFTQEVIDAPGIFLSLEPMKAKPKKKSFLKRLFSKKPKVTQITPRYTREQVEKKLALYIKSPDTLDAIVNDKNLFALVLQDIDRFNDANALYDALYMHINDTKKLVKIIRKRFGLILIDRDDDWKSVMAEVLAGKSEEYQNKIKDNIKRPTANWTVEALKSMYLSFMHSPQGHLDIIDCLLASNGGSYNQWELGVNVIGFTEGEEHETFNRSWGGDHGVKEGIEALPFNTTHELGHVVDYRLGVLSGEGKAMRKISNWKEIPNIPVQIIQFMEESVDGELYDGKLSEAELKVAHYAAIRYLAETNSSNPDSDWEKVKVRIRKLVEHMLGKGFKGLSTEEGKAIVDRICEVVSDKTINTNVFYHCWRGRASNKANEHFDDMMRGMNRPFHQGYEKRAWYSFDKSRWSNKISAYQYRDPTEEFAETYASYHAAPACGKKKGEMTPSHLLQWFLKEGLDKADPKSVKDGGVSKKDEDKK